MATPDSEVEEFVRRFLPEARSLAAAAGRKWSRSSWVDPADLESYAAERLIRAAQTWDPDRGCSERTWAHRHIRWAIFDALEHATAGARHHAALSLDKEWRTAIDTATPLVEFIPDPSDPIGEATAALAARQLLAVLDAAERDEILAYYWQERSLRSLGEERGVTESRMSQRLTASRERMRRASENAEALAAAHLTPAPG